jgi:hypothetical protein
VESEEWREESGEMRVESEEWKVENTDRGTSVMYGEFLIEN